MSGAALELLAAQEGIRTGVGRLADDLTSALGYLGRAPVVAPALAQIPERLDALPEAHPLRRRVPAVLWALWQRARDVLGLSRSVKWLGECPGWYDRETTRLARIDGQIVEVTDNRCWTLDLGAMLTDGEGREIWRRSRLAWPRDEDTIRVVCFSCLYQPELTSPEISDLVVAYVGGG